MSGIVGIVGLDGTPVEVSTLETLTAQLQFRGPDSRGTWCRANVGFGFTQLKTTDEGATDQQPLTLDGSTHIVCDARIDGRAQLIDALRTRGREVAPRAPDAALILNAYHAWGTDCIGKLLGDFAFAIWDGARKTLFCARDHFGVKQFFYAIDSETLVFGNTLDVVRSHPAVGTALNDLAIADFLLFGYNQELGTTSFRDVQRLPPAHSLLVSQQQGPCLRRYWTLPTDGAIRYRRQSEYVEHFQEILTTAVRDRLRTDRVAVSMSGGLDSTSVAAITHRVASGERPELSIRLCTNVYDRLIPDEERLFAGQVAESLGLPIHFEVLDDARLYAGWDRPGLELQEPAENFGAEPLSGALEEFLGDCRVVLTGFGGDPALAAPRAFVTRCILNGDIGKLLHGVGTCLWTHGRLPSLGLRSWLREKLGGQGTVPPRPEWLNADLVARLDLESRWDRFTRPALAKHPHRPEAYEALGYTAWPYAFGIFDPGSSRATVEQRHPFFDVRLVGYLLAMPAHPWFERKALLREAMRGILPESVRSRPKTLLNGDPAHAVAVEFDHACRESLLAAPGLAAFVDTDAVPMHIWNKSALASAEFLGNIRAFSLGYWLNHCWSRSNNELARGAG